MKKAQRFSFPTESKDWPFSRKDLKGKGMKITISKGARNADCEVSVLVNCPVSSQLAKLQMQDFVKIMANELARKVKDFSTELRNKEEGRIEQNET